MAESLESYKAFYSNHGHRYWDITREPVGERYTGSSSKHLTNDGDLIAHMMDLLPASAKGLDAGCGPGARDVLIYRKAGYDLHGVDAVAENIQLAVELNPTLEQHLSTADLSGPLSFADQEFDFLLCNCVIQHIPEEKVEQYTIPEFSRILKPGGILQFMFKTGHGLTRVRDPEYGVDRTFLLHQPDRILNLLECNHLQLIAEEDGEWGGVIRFTDPKDMPHCVLFARKM